MQIDPAQMEIDRRVADINRAMSGADRLKIANQLFLFVQGQIRASVRFDNPDWDEARVNNEVARRIAGELH